MEFEEFFNKAMEEFLKREIQEHKIGIYYPSELYNCIRKLWFMYKIPKELPIDTLRVFESGLMAHTFVRNVLFKSFLGKEELKEFVYEEPLVYEDGEIKISGKFDDLLHFRLGDKNILLEVKSVRDLRFFKEEVKEHHNMQLQFYINMIKKEVEALIMYIDRGNFKFKIFKVEKDENTFKRLVERAKKLHYYLIKNEVPLPEGKIDKDKKWMCSYCDYKKVCNEIGEKKVLKEVER